MNSNYYLRTPQTPTKSKVDPSISKFPEPLTPKHQSLSPRATKLRGKRCEVQNVDTRNDDESEVREEEEDEVLKLEEEVERMAEKVLEYRTTLPNQLTSTLASLLSSQRPIIPDPDVRTITGSDSEVGISQGMARPIESGSMALLVGEDQEEEEKIQLLKQRISINASKMQIVMQRMKEYMARIDKLESSNGVIHPAFKRKRTS